MILRRLSAWLGLKLAAPRREEPRQLPSALDLDEFTRLLYSGDPADLKRIARDLSISDPAAVWRQIRDRAAKPKFH
jgi:hypothetical protein